MEPLPVGIHLAGSVALPESRGGAGTLTGSVAEPVNLQAAWRSRDQQKLAFLELESEPKLIFKLLYLTELKRKVWFCNAAYRHNKQVFVVAGIEFQFCQAALPTYLT